MKSHPLTQSKTKQRIKQNMTFLTIEPNFDNAIFAPLQDVTPPAGKNSLDLKLNVLPEDYQLGIQTMFKRLTNQELAADATIYRLVFREGKQPAFYGPSLHKAPEAQASEGADLVIRWGLELLIPLKLVKGGVVALNAESQEPIQMVIEGGRIGAYKENVANLFVEEYAGYDELVMPFPVRRADYEAEFDLKLTKQAIKKADTEYFNVLLAEPKMGGSGGEVFTNDVLPQGVDLLVVEAKPVKTKHGQSYILTIAANAALELEETKVWAFSQTKTKLNKGAYVSRKEPGVLNFTKEIKEDGKPRYNMSFKPNWKQDANSVDMSSLLSSWSV